MYHLLFTWLKRRRGLTKSQYIHSFANLFQEIFLLQIGNDD